MTGGHIVSTVRSGGASGDEPHDEQPVKGYEYLSVVWASTSDKDSVSLVRLLCTFANWRFEVDEVNIPHAAMCMCHVFLHGGLCSDSPMAITMARWFMMAVVLLLGVSRTGPP